MSAERSAWTSAHRATRPHGPSGGCLAAVARDGPLVLLFEDMHWAEPPLLDLVDHLAARLRDAPVMLVCLARPELLAVRPTWGRHEAAHVTSVRLEPLSGDEASSC